MVSRTLPPGLVYHPADITAYDVTVGGYNGDPVPAYVARPSEDGPHPGCCWFTASTATRST